MLSVVANAPRGSERSGERTAAQRRPMLRTQLVDASALLALAWTAAGAALVRVRVTAYTCTAEM